MKVKQNSAINGILIWVCFHVLALVFLVTLPLKIDADFYSVLPANTIKKDVGKAEKIWSERSAHNITVLFGHKDLEVAKSAATAFYSIFNKNENVLKTRFFVEDSSLFKMRDFFFEYRNVLQDTLEQKMLFNENFEYFKNVALEHLYGAFSVANLNRLNEDPLFLGTLNFENLALQSPMLRCSKFSVQDSLLVAFDSSTYYVMWSALLSDNASALDSKDNIVGKINAALDSLENTQAGLIVVRTGVPFHSYESSKNAKAEIALISGISLTCIVLLLLFAFKTPVPIFSTLLSVSLAILTALSCTSLLCKNVHVLTLVFGTSVIGVGVDYCIHFFVERKHIKKGLSLGFLTTALCYTALGLTDFSILRQMAVFSVTGLLSVYLTVMFLYPKIFKGREYPAFSFKPLQILHYKVIEEKKRIPLKFISVVLMLILLIGLLRLNVYTDVRHFYAMSNSLKKNEMLYARLNNMGVTGAYFIVEGTSVEELLERETVLCKMLDSLVADSLMLDYLAMSRFFPPLSVQNKTYKSIENMFLKASNSGDFTFLKELQINENSFAIEPIKYLTLNADFPEAMQNILDMLYIGKVNGKFYSALLPMHLKKEFDIKQIAKYMPYVYAGSKIEDVNHALTKISYTVLFLLALSYACMLIVLSFVYGFISALKIIRAPVFAGVFVCAVFGYLSIPFDFFAMAGVLLTLGIGIDYALFFKEGNGRIKTTVAITLSAVTTLISFGSLAFSGFIPVSVLGKSILIGILSCFILSLLCAQKNTSIK